MIDTYENPIVLKYGKDGHLVARLPFDTMIHLISLWHQAWKNHQDRNDVLGILNAGHPYRLEDGGWLELENRHV